MQATVRKPATSFGNPLLANALGVMIAALVAAALTSTPVPLLGAIPRSTWLCSCSEWPCARLAAWAARQRNTAGRIR